MGRGPCCDKSKVRRGAWSPEEDLILTNFIEKHGASNWPSIPNKAGLLRCGKSCRLRWVNYLKPGLKLGNFTKEEEEAIIKLQSEFGNKWSKIASNFPGRTDNEIKNVWSTTLKKQRLNKKEGDHSHQKDETNEPSKTLFPSSDHEMYPNLVQDIETFPTNDFDLRLWNILIEEDPIDKPEFGQSSSLIDKEWDEWMKSFEK